VVLTTETRLVKRREIDQLRCCRKTEKHSLSWLKKRKEGRTTPGFTRFLRRAQTGAHGKRKMPATCHRETHALYESTGLVTRVGGVLVNPNRERKEKKKKRRKSSAGTRIDRIKSQKTWPGQQQERRGPGVSMG